MLCEPFDYGDDLRARLAAAENDLGKAETLRTRVVDAGEPDILEMEVLDPFDGLIALEFAMLVRLQQSCQFRQIHNCRLRLHSSIEPGIELLGHLPRLR